MALFKYFPGFLIERGHRRVLFGYLLGLIGAPSKEDPSNSNDPSLMESLREGGPRGIGNLRLPNTP